MATTYTYGGSTAITGSLTASFGGDQSGSVAAAFSNTRTFSNTGGTEPAIDGYVKGSVTCAAGDWLLAHATDPFQGMGDAGYSPGLTVAGKKIKSILIHNTDSTNSLTIQRKTGAGAGMANLLSADTTLITIAPGCRFLWEGATLALTAATNDGVTLTVSAGAPVATVLIAYGS